MLILLYIHKSKPQQGHLASHCQVGPGDLSLVRLVADTVPGGGEAGAGLLVVQNGAPWFHHDLRQENGELAGLVLENLPETWTLVVLVAVLVLVDSIHVLIVDVPSFLSFPPNG